MIAQLCAVVPLSVDASSLMADIELLTNAAQRSPEMRRRVEALGDLADYVSEADCDSPSGLVRVRFEFSGAVAALVAELRAQG